MLTCLRVVFLTSLAATGLLTQLSAQQTPPLAPGARVRVGGVVGTLESIDSASIVLRRPNGREGSIPRRPDTRLDVSIPGICSAGHRMACVTLGGLGGLALGVGVGAFKVRNCRPGREDLCPLWYVLTLPSGLLVGAVVGAFVWGEHWRRVEIPVHLSLDPGVPGAQEPWRGFRVGARLAF